jgi:hypothetical protein
MVNVSRSTLLLVALAAPLPLCPSALLSGQVRASEAASLSQTIDGTKLSLTYSRPRARTRDSLFGKIVTWGEVWTPGANMATTLELSKSAKLNGHPVPKGKYSVWMVVRASGDWTFVLDPRAELYHMQHPDSTAQQIRFGVRTAEKPFLEVLTWSVPEVSVDGATHAMQWGTTYVPIDVQVEPSYQLGFPERESGPYLGRYEYSWKGAPADTTKPVTFTVTYEKGNLMGRWDPAPFPDLPEWSRFALIRIKGDWFIPAYLDERGGMLEVEKGMVFEFTVASGRASGIDVRGEDDKLMATAKRKD